jgi:hypothetical protein
MRIMKFWPFEVSDENEKAFPPTAVWLPRVAIVGLFSGLAGLMVVSFLH